VTPSLCVVIPVKDDAEALGRCLAGIARQRRAPCDVVVVDNGSSDTSAQVALAHGARVVREPRPGIPAAAATGYDHATGDVIVRCDADSVPADDWLDRIAAAFAADPDLDGLTGTGRFYGVPPWRARVVGGLYLGSYRLLVRGALAQEPMWGSNMALRRSTWLEVTGAVHRDDPELHDDVDLTAVLGPSRTVRHDPRLVVQVSGRSLGGRRQLRRRFRRAARTLAVCWQTGTPRQRWARRWGLEVQPEAA